MLTGITPVMDESLMAIEDLSNNLLQFSYFQGFDDKFTNTDGLGLGL